MMRASVLVLLVLFSCNGKDGDFEACETVEDCSDGPNDESPACLGKADEGYCTWECSVDSDCDDSSLVCSAFASETTKYCFPSCENDSENEGECPEYFSCASTGGGNENRKVCFPDD